MENQTTNDAFMAGFDGTQYTAPKTTPEIMQELKRAESYAADLRATLLKGVADELTNNPEYLDMMKGIIKEQETKKTMPSFF
jgi:hypothetical protein